MRQRGGSGRLGRPYATRNYSGLNRPESQEAWELGDRRLLFYWGLVRLGENLQVRWRETAGEESSGQTRVRGNRHATVWDLALKMMRTGGQNFLPRLGLAVGREQSGEFYDSDTRTRIFRDDSGLSRVIG